MKVGFICESPNDEAVFPGIVRKILGFDFESVARRVDPEAIREFKKGEGYRQFRGYVKLLSKRDCSLVIVIRDSEGTPKGEKMKILKKQIEMVKPSEPLIHFAYGIAVEAMDAWLMADIEALRRVMPGRVDEILNPTDKIEEPKKLLDNIIQKASGGALKYNSETLRMRASELDLKTASNRKASQSFHQFVKDFPKGPF